MTTSNCLAEVIIILKRNLTEVERSEAQKLCDQGVSPAEIAIKIGTNTKTAETFISHHKTNDNDFSHK